MAIQRISVDLIPGAKVAPIINASQYDNGRQFEIELLNGGEAFTPTEGMTIELHVKKRDDTIIINSPINRTNNIITFSTTEQMTACHGTNVCEVSISDDGLLIGTANFILEVEKDPIEGGLTSESEIDNLTQQIADIVPTVIGNDYYNKTQTDALLANKANISDLPDMTDYYTKTQTDNLLYNKVDYDELNRYYKKTEVDNLLNAKVDKTTLQSDYYDANYISTQFARKSFVENYVDATATASGNPCTFNTAKYHTLIPALTAEIVCGGGGGTPSAPIPIVGHSALNLDVNGNTFTVQFGQTVYGGVYDKSGRLTITHAVIDLGTLDYGYSAPRFTYIFVSGIYPTPFSDVANAKCSIYTCKSRAEIEQFDNAFSLSTGGDETVVLNITDSRFTDGASLKTALSGIMLCYELATPIVIDVPSISVFAENGVNNIVSDGGSDVNVSYKDTIQHYIDSRI